LPRRSRRGWHGAPDGVDRRHRRLGEAAHRVGIVVRVDLAAVCHRHRPGGGPRPERRIAAFAAGAPDALRAVEGPARIEPDIGDLPLPGQHIAEALVKAAQRCRGEFCRVLQLVRTDREEVRPRPDRTCLRGEERFRRDPAAQPADHLPFDREHAVEEVRAGLAWAEPGSALGAVVHRTLSVDEPGPRSQARYRPQGADGFGTWPARHSEATKRVFARTLLAQPTEVTVPYELRRPTRPALRGLTR